MLVEINNLKTLHSWAKEWTRDVGGIQKRGCSVQHAHKLFNPDNKEPVALRVREEWHLLTIDGVKFVVKISDLTNQNQKEA
jgi:hypothetical protein